MKTSEDRIITTHVGSLPRSPELIDLLVKKEKGEGVDENEFQKRVAADLDFVIQKQLECGIDVIGDGEMPRLGFSFYVKDRMSGFGGECHRGTVTDFTKFPGYAEMKFGKDKQPTKSASLFSMPECQCAVKYDRDGKVAKEELGLFADALERNKAAGDWRETFVTAAGPGIVSTTLLRSEDNPDYASDEEYVMGLAEELRHEYELIVSEGHILQIDAPDILEWQILYLDKPMDVFLDRLAVHVKGLNHALMNIPREKVRMHVCWGNWDGPHGDDIDLEPLLPVLYQAKVGAISFAFANPRHAHELKLLKKFPLPDDMLLFPGLIDVTTNMLEHPELVADRIEAAAEAVGDPKKIIASTDCGFSTFAGYLLVAPDVTWAKLKMLSEGAAIASERLF